MILTVRPENAPTIILWQKYWLTFYGFDPYYFGNNLDSGRMLMEAYLQASLNTKSHSNLTDAEKAIETVCIKMGSKTDLQARRGID